MKNKALLALIFLAAPAAAVAQDSAVMWADLQGTRPFSTLQQDERRGQGKGGQVVEEWYTPTMRVGLSFFGRASFAGNSDVTIDHIWYSDLFDPGLGLSVEGDLITFITPQYGVGGYLSVGWDRFDGNTVHFAFNDEVTPDHMDLTTVIIGAKFVGRAGPFFFWEGRIGGGMVHYSAVNWSGIDTGVPFSNEQLFRPINRFVFDTGARFGFGNPRIQGDLGFGYRIMGAAARGKDVTSAVDPDLLDTFMIELGLTIRF